MFISAPLPYRVALGRPEPARCPDRQRFQLITWPTHRPFDRHWWGRSIATPTPAQTAAFRL